MVTVTKSYAIYQTVQILDTDNQTSDQSLLVDIIDPTHLVICLDSNTYALDDQIAQKAHSICLVLSDI